jgi:NAD+ synthase (glutamine-hydrolysing)
MGVVPKSFIPNYKEFYERRWFAPAAAGSATEIRLVSLGGLGGTVDLTPFGTDLLFTCHELPELVVGIEICEDLWTPIPPSGFQALAGATLLANLSASNDLVGKAAYRRQLVGNQSARCLASYVYTSCGIGESTTDLVFGGHAMIAENGVLLAEAERFQRRDTVLTADVDVQRLVSERQRQGTFRDAWLDPRLQRPFRRVCFHIDWEANLSPLRRTVDAHPFVPSDLAELRDRCHEIFNIQVAALARRLEHIGKPAVAIGVSGGLDSTLALLVTCKTFDLLGQPRQQIRTLTMPGFGTTARTLGNAHALMQHLHTSIREIDIRSLCLAEFRALEHAPFGLYPNKFDMQAFTEALRGLPKDRRTDLTFENVQARMRTSLLMNTGFVIGTGDVSELALGWCTFNGDHMSMYNPNVSIPKTLVKFLVRWVAENEFDGEARRILLDIVATEISPELLPAASDGQVQSTEGTIGPYELHDFFLYHFLRLGFSPDKILYLASLASFERQYREAEVRNWLRVFLTRFFNNQFKRSSLPDGPKVGSVSLSPRGDWRMPSDASLSSWLASWR